MLAQIHDAREFDSLFAHKKVESVRISALISAYGTGLSFFQIYEQNRRQAVLARLDDDFFLLDNGADFEELAVFLRMEPHFSCLCGPADAVEKLAALIPGARCETFCRMAVPEAPTLRKQAETPFKRFSIDRDPPLRAVYPLSGPKSGAFDAWYADVSHRIRHGCARAYLLRADGAPASACLISAESEWAGLISGVFTVPSCRGRGLASALVSAASADLIACGKQPVLDCLAPLSGFYARLGFSPAGGAAVLMPGGK